VTIDAAALCLKSGNAIVLRGSSSAAHSNAVLAGIAAEASGLPEGAVTLLSGGREELAELARQTGIVDLVIPRGGEGLKKALEAVATVPVIYAASGNCHVYVDASADVDAAQRIILNAKTQRPGVCNAAETLLVHVDAAPAFLPRPPRRCAPPGVELRVDGRTRALVGGADTEATDEDWDTEYLSLTLAVGSSTRSTRRSSTSTSTAPGTPRRSSPATSPRRARSSGASTPPASTSTPRRASPTAASSAWAPRSATRPRSSTPAGRSACASCARSSTSWRATGTSA
jgi:hypothetical protein